MRNGTQPPLSWRLRDSPRVQFAAYSVGGADPLVPRTFQRVHPPAVRFPESFRGGCSFGGASLALSSTGFACLAGCARLASGGSVMGTPDCPALESQSVEADERFAPQNRFGFGRILGPGRIVQHQFRTQPKRRPRALPGAHQNPRCRLTFAGPDGDNFGAT